MKSSRLSNMSVTTSFEIEKLQLGAQERALALHALHIADAITKAAFSVARGTRMIFVHEVPNLSFRH